MKIETVDLYANFKRERKGNEKGTLTCYLHSELPEMNERHKRPAILVIPGGGYEWCSAREGEPVALQFFHQGFNAYVLEYSCAPEFHYPDCLIEAGMSMLYIRDHSQRHGNFADKVAVIGFSAGGHLAGMASLLYEDKALQQAFGARCKEIRPDASVYSYAVVSSEHRFAHEGSFNALCADRVKPEDYSLEKKVAAGCAPAFIWATMDDACVNAQNSLELAMAYKKAGVPCELHIFESGTHGLSICDTQVTWKDYREPNIVKTVAQWLPLCYNFLEVHGFVVEKVLTD